MAPSNAPFSTPEPPTPHGDTVLRACLPEILLTPDVRTAFGFKTDAAARGAIRRGDCGPYFRIGRRLAVRRESLIEACAARAIHPIRRSPIDGGR